MTEHSRTEADVRLPLKGELFAAIEAWRRAQPRIPSRNEAVRTLLILGLARNRITPVGEWSPDAE